MPGDRPWRCRVERTSSTKSGLLQLAARDVDRQPETDVSLVRPRPCLTAGLVQHPLPELNDESGVFGKADEVHGRYQPAGGVSPPHEGLGTDDLSGVDVHDRLVEHEEFLRPNRSLQLGSQGEPVQHSSVQTGVVTDQLTFPALLRRIKGQICAAQQPSQVQICFGAGSEDQTGAGAGQRLLALHGQRGAERGQHPMHEPRCFTRVGDVLDQDRELVPAEPGHCGASAQGAQGALQPAGHGDEQFVAGGVAAGVVDVLEVVDVDHDDPDEGPSAAGPWPGPARRGRGTVPGWPGR